MSAMRTVDLTSDQFFSAGLWAVSDAPDTVKPEALPDLFLPILPGEVTLESELQRLLNPTPTFRDLVLGELRPMLLNREVVVPQEFDRLFDQTKKKLKKRAVEQELTEKEKKLLYSTGELLSREMGLRELLRAGIHALIAGI